MNRVIRYFTAAVTLATASAVGASDITKEYGDLAVRVTDASGEVGWPRIEIRRFAAGAPVTMELEGTRVVKDVLFTGPNRITIHGELGGRGDIITIIDTQSNKIIDTLWGWRAAFSPDLKTVVYEFRTPSSPGQVRLSAALMAYDLTASPASNTMPGTRDHPEERGIALYPERHRLIHRPWIVLDEVQPQRMFESPIAWSPDSRRVAVVDHHPGGDLLVTVGISKGLRQPSVSVFPISREAFLEARHGGVIPREYAGAPLLFEELQFSSDGQSVRLRSFGSGPFSEKIVTLPVPAPSQ